jgi:ABC-type sugar transport system substrate-binding protein
VPEAVTPILKRARDRGVKVLAWTGTCRPNRGRRQAGRSVDGQVVSDRIDVGKDMAAKIDET